ncbi:hypothetical protein GDO81_011867 [Engystomops pustulosus]|uniref:Uncharacterized protein n=1 Tax=Engystomops pustulosus TaxID=76066 RepID=A0AAV7BHA7_ENGPU|nr:hypothetical protein GDO81_011867 [Engystomops pustulosus]
MHPTKLSRVHHITQQVYRNYDKPIYPVLSTNIRICARWLGTQGRIYRTVSLKLSSQTNNSQEVRVTTKYLIQYRIRVHEG